MSGIRVPLQLRSQRARSGPTSHRHWSQAQQRGCRLLGAACSVPCTPAVWGPVQVPGGRQTGAGLWFSTPRARPALPPSHVMSRECVVPAVFPVTCLLTYSEPLPVVNDLGSSWSVTAAFGVADRNHSHTASTQVPEPRRGSHSGASGEQAGRQGRQPHTPRRSTGHACLVCAELRRPTACRARAATKTGRGSPLGSKVPARGLFVSRLSH